MTEVIMNETGYIFSCPHCNLMIEVGKNDVNCSIFRHGYYYTKNNSGEILLLGQLSPHASKSLCDQLLKENKIYGCGKPFKMDRINNNYTIRICDYI